MYLKYWAKDSCAPSTHATFVDDLKLTGPAITIASSCLAANFKLLTSQSLRSSYVRVALDTFIAHPAHKVSLIYFKGLE